MTLVAIGIVFWPQTPSIHSAHEKFVHHVKNKQFHDAYQMLTPEFQKKYSFVTFVDFFTVNGDPVPVSAANYIVIDTNEATINHAPGRSSLKWQYKWKLVNGRWLIDNFYLSNW